MTTILYLHGFLSSSQSAKAQQTLNYANQQHPDVNVLIPQIPNTIDIAVNYLEKLIETHFIQQSKPILCIGSSMGGFLSHWLIEKYASMPGCKAVLVNPAVAPHLLMQDYLGEHTNPYSQQRFVIDAEQIQILRQLEPSYISDPSRYKVMLQSGDEVLDYQLAVALYQGADIQVERGGDHSFVGYDQHLSDVFRFLLG